MLCEDNYITDLNDILRQFIYYDKYGYQINYMYKKNDYNLF